MNTWATHHLARLAAPIVVAGLAAHQVAAQQSEDAEEPLDEQAQHLAAPVAPPMEVSPADASTRALGQDSPVQQPTLIREGAVLNQRIGVLRRLRGGGWAFIAHSPIGERIALVLMPNTRLTEMTRMVDAAPDPIAFELSGQVFAYRGRNYLLASRFRATTAETAQTAQIAQPPATPKTDNDPFTEQQTPSGATSIDDLLAEVDDRSEPPAKAPTDRARAEASLTEDTAHGLALLREGTVISARLGRLRPSTTASGSGWMLVADADADMMEDALAGVPLLLMPCQNLQGMERLVSDFGDRLRFTVSGIVHVYDGQNYLLPTMYLVELDRSGNLTSAQ